jgi:hypothetical protein
VSGLTHNDYLTHGAIGPALLPEKWPDPKGVRRTNYDRICRHILLFFDATLKQQADPREALQKSIRGEGLDDGFRLTFKPAASVPPTHRQLAVYLKEHGVEKTLKLASRTASRATPTARLASAAACLLRDVNAAAALPALRYAVKEDPRSTIHHIWLGQALALTGDRAGALAAYRKAAELHPHDQTMGNSGGAYKYFIDKGLKELGAPEPPRKDR